MLGTTTSERQRIGRCADASGGRDVGQPRDKLGCPTRRFGFRFSSREPKAWQWSASRSLTPKISGPRSGSAGSLR